MEEFCQNPLCENKAVKEVPISVEKPSDQFRLLCAACEETYTWGVQHGTMICEGPKVEPPPEEKGDEPLFRVVYIIDVNAANAREAAEYTHRIMTDPDSMRPVLLVIDSKGVCTQVDLSAGTANQEDITDTVDYKAAAQYLADKGALVFTGPMKGGLWNGRCMDASIMSKKQGDKAAYEFLIKFGNQYASSLPASQQHRWQEIKKEAAGMLENRKKSARQKKGGTHAQQST